VPSLGAHKINQSNYYCYYRNSGIGKNIIGNVLTKECYREILDKNISHHSNVKIIL